jgi:CubicO group peptidase (beta-lactamase class C family)
MCDMDAIARLLDDARTEGLGSATAVSVGDAGVEVFRYAAGRTRRVPDAGQQITDHTPFDVASLTKPMATVAIAMVLVAERALDLAAPVRAYVPKAATTGTVHQLLGHAAGCVAHVELFRRLRAERPADPHARLVSLAAREPAGPPGVQAVYSDLGYILLGAVLEAAGGASLAELFERCVARPLHLAARYATTTIDGAVATELDERGLVCGRVHDENAYEGGGMFGHAGLFASLDDVARFAAAIVMPGSAFSPERFFSEAPVPGASWRLGWDTPSHTPGVSAAGDRWPRERAVGHMGFTGTSIWLDLARRRWVVLLTNRVHPTRFAGTAERIKALRRSVHDAVVDALGDA